MHLSHAMVCADLKERNSTGGIQEVHNKDLILCEKVKEVKEIKEATSGCFFLSLFENFIAASLSLDGSSLGQTMIYWGL